MCIVHVSKQLYSFISVEHLLCRTHIRNGFAHALWVRRCFAWFTSIKFHSNFIQLSEYKVQHISVIRCIKSIYCRCFNRNLLLETSFAVQAQRKFVIKSFKYCVVLNIWNFFPTKHWKCMFHVPIWAMAQMPTPAIPLFDLTTRLRSDDSILVVFISVEVISIKQ